MKYCRCPQLTSILISGNRLTRLPSFIGYALSFRKRYHPTKPGTNVKDAFFHFQFNPIFCDEDIAWIGDKDKLEAFRVHRERGFYRFGDIIIHEFQWANTICGGPAELRARGVTLDSYASMSSMFNVEIYKWGSRPAELRAWGVTLDGLICRYG